MFWHVYFNIMQQCSSIPLDAYKLNAIYYILFAQTSLNKTHKIFLYSNEINQSNYDLHNRVKLNQLCNRILVYNLYNYMYRFYVLPTNAYKNISYLKVFYHIPYIYIILHLILRIYFCIHFSLKFPFYYRPIIFSYLFHQYRLILIHISIIIMHRMLIHSALIF